MHTHTRACMHTRRHTHRHTYTHAHSLTHLHAHTHTCTRTHTHTHVRTHTYTHTHTHTRTHLFDRRSSISNRVSKLNAFRTEVHKRVNRSLLYLSFRITESVDFNHFRSAVLRFEKESVSFFCRSPFIYHHVSCHNGGSHLFEDLASATESVDCIVFVLRYEEELAHIFSTYNIYTGLFFTYICLFRRSLFIHF